MEEQKQKRRVNHNPLRFSIKDFYDPSGCSVDYRRYSQIAKAFAKYLVLKIQEGHRIQLPANMGVVQILGTKQQIKIVDGVVKGLSPDWKATREYWAKNPDDRKIIYHTNMHTDNIRYKIRWFKTGIRAKFKSFYNIRFARGVKRSTSIKILENWANYAVL